MEKFNVAVIGCGNISDAYLGTMTSKFKILNVIGCSDLDTEKMENQANKYGIKAMSMDEIIKDESIKIVVNITPSPAHYFVTKQLLEGGKHVYSEKVLSMTLEQGEELVNLANENGLYLGVAPDTFLGSALQTAKYIIESGMIGDVTSFYAALTRDVRLQANFAALPISPGGGIAFDVGIYYVIALLSLLGPVKTVSGIMKTIEPEQKYEVVSRKGEAYTIMNENKASATLEFESGVIGNMLFDSTSMFILPENPGFVIHGTLGILYLADPNHFGGEVKVLLKGNQEPMVMQSIHPFDGEARGLGVAEMAWSMVNNRPNRASKEMAYHAIEVLHGINQSGQERRHVDMLSSFVKPEALPRGYRGGAYFSEIEESVLAL